MIVLGSLQSKAQQEVKVSDLPCKGSKFKTDKDHYCGYGYGISNDVSVARNKANMQAMQELSTSIKSQLSSVTTLYVRSTEKDGSSQDFEGIISESVNESLEGVKVLCQKQEKMTDGKTKVYITIEVNRAELIQRIETKTKQDKYAKLDFDKAKFEEIFNKEMENKK